MKKEKTKSVEAKLIMDYQSGPMNVWYKHNEREADLMERRVEAHRIWADKVLLYLSMVEENKRVGTCQQKIVKKNIQKER